MPYGKNGLHVTIPRTLFKVKEGDLVEVISPNELSEIDQIKDRLRELEKEVKNSGGYR